MPIYRYFTNPFLNSDFSESEPEVPKDEICQTVKEILSKITTKVEATQENASDGIYLGTAGIAYMFYQISKNPVFENQKTHLLNEAIRYMKPALNIAKYSTKYPADIPSFILGNGGIYAVAAAIYSTLGDMEQGHLYSQQYQEAAKICNAPSFLNNGSDELFVGRAGYIMGALWIAKETKIAMNKDEIWDICSVIVSSGREYSKANKSASPLMYSYYQIEYLGAAHGLSSILLALMLVPGYLDEHLDVKKDVQLSVDFLLNIQDNEGNFPDATDEIGLVAQLVHWCHGAGGIIYMMARAYIVFQSPKYLKSCEKMADLIWNKGLLKKGPGICHGVAGSGYVFLLMYRLTKKPLYLHRAVSFFKFMGTQEFKDDARIPDSPYSLFEGIAGTACFLADLTYPDSAVFPFFDVFD